MVPVTVNPANQNALTPSGIPDAAKAGPAWIQIGTEGGFLPAPVVVPQQPIGWNLNATTFNFGNVNQHSLLLGPAERADVIVDFTGLRRQDAHPLQRRSRGVPGGRQRLRLLHGRRQPDRHRRRARHAARLRPQHPHGHADQGDRRVGAADCRRHPREPQRGVRQGPRRQARRLRGHAGPDHRSAGRLQLRVQKQSSRRLRRPSMCRSPTRRRPSSPSTAPAFCSLLSPSRSRRRASMTRWAACTTRSSAA